MSFFRRWSLFFRLSLTIAEEGIKGAISKLIFEVGRFGLFLAFSGWSIRSTTNNAANDVACITANPIRNFARGLIAQT